MTTKSWEVTKNNNNIAKSVLFINIFSSDPENDTNGSLIILVFEQYSIDNFLFTTVVPFTRDTRIYKSIYIYGTVW
jgi:predicted 2-oxoglutarate/Fe(II)-dependent dioxygenase YbiX